jgi:hypothetical protein
MSFYPSGSRCTWVGYFDGSAFSNQNVTDAIQAVSSGLKNKYSLVVERAAPDAGLGSYTSGAIALDLRTDMDRGNGSDGLADIKSNCDDEFTLSGNAASSSRIYTRDGVGTTSTPDNYDSCSGLWDKFQNAIPTWLGGSPVTASQQACYTKQGKAQVQSVTTNAQKAYGVGSATAVATEQAANVQSAQVAGDTAAISDAARAAAASHDQTMLYIALGVGVVVVIIVGVVAIK